MISSGYPKLEKAVLKCVYQAKGGQNGAHKCLAIT